jgi:hypothetical protein
VRNEGLLFEPAWRAERRKGGEHISPLMVAPDFPYCFRAHTSLFSFSVPSIITDYSSSALLFFEPVALVRHMAVPS